MTRLAARLAPLRFAVLRCAVLLSAVLLCGVASAQEKKGAPPELIGKYGSSPAACQSYHRKSDGGLQEFFEDEWDNFCRRELPRRRRLNS